MFPLKVEMGLPIRFIGVGEQMDDLQPFNGFDFAKALAQSGECALFLLETLGFWKRSLA